MIVIVKDEPLTVKDKNGKILFQYIKSETNEIKININLKDKYFNKLNQLIEQEEVLWKGWNSK